MGPPGERVEIATTHKMRDLGVQVAGDFEAESQCRAAVAKANRALYQMRETMVTRNPRALVPLFKALVRPHLEYAVQAWCPYLAKDKKMLERPQRRSTKWFREMRMKPYEERLLELDLFSLQRRRKRAYAENYASNTPYHHTEDISKHEETHSYPQVHSYPPDNEASDPLEANNPPDWMHHSAAHKNVYDPPGTGLNGIENDEPSVDTPSHQVPITDLPHIPTSHDAGYPSRLASGVGHSPNPMLVFSTNGHPRRNTQRHVEVKRMNTNGMSTIADLSCRRLALCAPGLSKTALTIFSVIPYQKKMIGTASKSSAHRVHRHGPAHGMSAGDWETMTGAVNGPQASLMQFVSGVSDVVDSACANNPSMESVISILSFRPNDDEVLSYASHLQSRCILWSTMGNPTSTPLVRMYGPTGYSDADTTMVNHSLMDSTGSSATDASLVRAGNALIPSGYVMARRPCAWHPLTTSSVIPVNMYVSAFSAWSRTPFMTLRQRNPSGTPASTGGSLSNSGTAMSNAAATAVAAASAVGGGSGGASAICGTATTATGAGGVRRGVNRTAFIYPDPLFYYAPYLLDDPELLVATGRRLFQLPNYLTSVLTYVRPTEQKRNVNREFHERFPLVQLTLTKLRSIKAMLVQIVLKLFVQKSNRRLCASAALLVSAKLNDVKGTDLVCLIQELESGFRISRRDLLHIELDVALGLEFCLIPMEVELLPHYFRIHQRLDLTPPYPISCLGYGPPINTSQNLLNDT